MNRDAALGVDVREIRLDIRKSKADRIRDYIRQTGNPYRVRIGEVVVDMEFSKGGQPLQALLEETTMPGM